MKAVKFLCGHFEFFSIFVNGSARLIYAYIAVSNFVKSVSSLKNPAYFCEHNINIIRLFYIIVCAEIQSVQLVILFRQMRDRERALNNWLLELGW